MPPANLKIKKPKSVSELVLEQLRNEIIQGVFDLGERLSEASLAERYGVTKAPIRTAYIRLESEGLLEIKPQSGTYVFKPDHLELRAMCELRIALEVEAARLAFERDPIGVRNQFAAILAQMVMALETSDLEHYQNLDTDLHLMIVDRARSSLLGDTYRRQVSRRFEALRFRFSQRSAHTDASIAEHKALNRAAAEGNSEDFCLLLRDHVAKTEIYYAEFMDSPPLDSADTPSKAG